MFPVHAAVTLRFARTAMWTLLWKVDLDETVDTCSWPVCNEQQAAQYRKQRKPTQIQNTQYKQVLLRKYNSSNSFSATQLLPYTVLSSELCLQISMSLQGKIAHDSVTQRPPPLLSIKAVSPFMTWSQRSQQHIYKRLRVPCPVPVSDPPLDSSGLH